MGNKVLLVDDDEKLRKLVAEYLEGYGFQVTALPDSRSVLSTIRNESPDIVILDIMLTAKGDDADRIVGLELGADDYLPKPFNPRELLARIKAVTRRIPSQGVGGADVTSQAIRRQLKAILSADVKDYSRLMSENEMWTIQTLKNYRSLIASHVRSHQGRVVDSPGDNLLAEFGSVVHAAECAVEIQRNLSTRNKTLPDDKRMEYRIGVNLGDVVIDRGKLYGDGVNIAARIEKLADPGGIAVSGTVYDEIENKLPLSCEFIGEHTVKNILKPIRVYRIKI